MHIFNYQITLSTKYNDIPHLIDNWFSALANIYGHPSKNFDGYITMVMKESTSIVIICYLIEGNEEHQKLEYLKTRNKDWSGFRSLCIMNAIKSHARLLGYTIETTSIELLSPKDGSVTSM